MSPVEVLDFIQKQSTCYLIDTLGFEKHMRQIRERRGEPIPPIWYKRPHAYGLRLTSDKIKGPGDTLFSPPLFQKRTTNLKLSPFSQNL